jgi:N-methylhydantoinase A
VFSALGLLVADVRRDYVAAFPAEAGSADPGDVERAFAAMEAEAIEALGEDGFAGDRVRLERSADLKVQGQTYELNVAMPGGPVTRESLGALLAAFGARYRERYAFFFEGEPIEIVNLRLAALGVQAPVRLAEAAPGPPAPPVRRPIYFEGRGWTDCAVWDRGRLRPGQRVEGPASIEDPSSTILVPPGETAEVAADLGLFVSLRR